MVNDLILQALLVSKFHLGMILAKSHVLYQM